MAKIQKPDPKKFATIGKLKEIIAKNNSDKKYIEDKRKAYGTDMSNADEGDLKDQVRLAQIEDQNKRYGELIAKANKEAAAKAAKSKNMVPISRLKEVRDSLYNVADMKKSSGLGLLMKGNITDKTRDKINAYNSSASSDIERADRYNKLINKK